ncbi:MAG: HAD superfamily hydrolase (TIGR01662 family) [Bacteroidia bacterium]|jgi:HAD superfamily hydrolase (TIGR01662 family)
MQPNNSHLPHTRQRPRGLFVDRWGTLLAIPPSGYVKHPDELEFLPGALDSLYHAARLGWKIYLIGNEDAVAHGDLSESAWETIQVAIEERLLDSGIEVTRSYACLDHPEGKGAHEQPSVFRLPETGIFYHAQHNDDLHLEKSWVIGDSTIELAAAWRAGMRYIGVRTGQALGDKSLDVDPDLIVADLPAALASLSRAQAEAA